MKEAFNCKWCVLAGPWVTVYSKPAARIKARKQAFDEINSKSRRTGNFTVRGREFIKYKNVSVEQQTFEDGTYRAIARMHIFVCDEGYKRETNRFFGS